VGRVLSYCLFNTCHTGGLLGEVCGMENGKMQTILRPGGPSVPERVPRNELLEIYARRLIYPCCARRTPQTRPVIRFYTTWGCCRPRALLQVVAHQHHARIGGGHSHYKCKAAGPIPQGCNHDQPQGRDGVRQCSPVCGAGPRRAST
jgi:hypothetical protein